MQPRTLYPLGFNFVSVVLTVFILGAVFCCLYPRPARAISTTIVIHEFRTRGPAGEGDDFIELVNRSDENVSIAGWQVVAAKTRSAMPAATVVIFNDVVLYPGSHYLITGPAYSGAVRPDQGFAGMADNVGIGLLTPTGALVDAVATDFALYEEGQPLVTRVTNEDWSYERISFANGMVVDTDHNSNDFRLISPSTPQNLAISLISGFGSANPSMVGLGHSTLITVEVTPGQSPTSTGLAVAGALSLIGGAASQPFYDDGTHGDAKAADNVFSFQAPVSESTALGEMLLPVYLTDLQGRTTPLFIGLNVQPSPPPVACSQERLSVKTGTDADVEKIGLSAIAPTTIATMRDWPKPSFIPSNNRIPPYEATVWVMNATLTGYQLDDDSDYHLVLKDDSGNTIIARIPCACCVGAASPFITAIAKARAQFDARVTATNTFQTANIPVRITGIGFFDAPHDQMGAAPNGGGLHPVLEIKFDVDLHLPRIIGASVSGKKLFVSGLNFDDGAKIYLNGEKQKSANDADSPTTLLVGKKAGKQIERGVPITLQIKNSDGKLSESFTFTSPAAE